jgi:hypothetical protein
MTPYQISLTSPLRLLLFKPDIKLYLLVSIAFKLLLTVPNLGTWELYLPKTEETLKIYVTG